MKINWFKIEFDRIFSIMKRVFRYKSFIDLSEFLIYLNIGFECKDCEKLYVACSCNFCEYCKYDKCICKYDRKEIWNELIKFSKLNFSFRRLKPLIEYLNDFKHEFYESSKEYSIIEKYVKELKNA